MKKNKKNMKILKAITFAAICFTFITTSVVAQSTVNNAVVDQKANRSKSAVPVVVNIYSTAFDVSALNESSELVGKGIFGQAMIMNLNTFKSKLDQFVVSGEVTNVSKKFISVVDGNTGKMFGGRELVVVKSDAKTENELEFINAGSLFRATPIVVRSQINSVPDSVSLALEMTDNDVDTSVLVEGGVPDVIKREIKIKETFYPGNVRILGGFLSKDGLTRRYYAVWVEVIDSDSTIINLEN